VTAETEAAVASLPAFEFNPAGPCAEECSNCCLPASLSPTLEGAFLPGSPVAAVAQHNSGIIQLRTELFDDCRHMPLKAPRSYVQLQS